MSDIEEVIIPRKKKDTKPEIAREKLKEKRIRLKKEKDDLIIEEAKKRLAQEEVKKKQEEEMRLKQEQEKLNSDPQVQLLKRFEALFAKLDEKVSPHANGTPVQTAAVNPVQEIEAKPKKKRTPKPRSSVPDEIVYAEPPKEAVAPKQRKKKVVIQDVIESPSNNFVGDESPPANTIEYPNNQSASHPLLSVLMSRRSMGAWN
jgi:hypothetical protein